MVVALKAYICFQNKGLIFQVLGGHYGRKPSVANTLQGLHHLIIVALLNGRLYVFKVATTVSSFLHALGTM